MDETDENAPDARDVAVSLRMGIGMLLRRFKQTPAPGDLTLPESSALSRLDRGGPANAAELARQEQISPQSMGATLTALQSRGLIEKTPDPSDGRRYVLSITKDGLDLLHQRRTVRTDALARALTDLFTPDELTVLKNAGPLLERLAENI